MLLLLSKHFLVESFVSQKAKFENKLKALFDVCRAVFGSFLALGPLSKFF